MSDAELLLRERRVKKSKVKNDAEISFVSFFTLLFLTLRVRRGKKSRAKDNADLCLRVI